MLSIANARFVVALDKACAFPFASISTRSVPIETVMTIEKIESDTMSSMSEKPRFDE
jgi:hypothetical protein